MVVKVMLDAEVDDDETVGDLKHRALRLLHIQPGEAVWRADNSQLNSSETGLLLRGSPDIGDKLTVRLLWGHWIWGVPTADNEWVKVTRLKTESPLKDRTMYVPLKLDGVAVLARVDRVLGHHPRDRRGSALDEQRPLKDCNLGVGSWVSMVGARLPGGPSAAPQCVRDADISSAATLREKELLLQLQECQDELVSARRQLRDCCAQLATARRDADAARPALNEYAMAVAAPLPWPSYCAEFGVERLAPEDPIHRLLATLFVGSCVQHRKSQGSPEMMPAPLLRVLRIEAVVNPRLARAYHSKVEEVEGLRRGSCSAIPALAQMKVPARKGTSPSCPDLNEHFLFHGASREVVLDICRGGFDPRRGGEGAGKMFGVATYFAANASKSDIYTDGPAARHPRRSERQILVARAVLGEAHRATQPKTAAARPPDGPDGHPFDSVWADTRQNGGAVDHLEVMVYDKGQAYPEAVITYAHEEACRCAQCARRPKK